MESGILLNYLGLRALVGFLGEKTQLGWWETTFLSPTGRQFLAVTFPRTSLAAAITSTAEAARRLHDDRIGKGGVFHLFRLPLTIEEQLHQSMLSEALDPILPNLTSRELALDRLRKLCNGGLRAPEGPVQVGTQRNLMSSFAIEELAKHYHDAFNRGAQTFPYFTANP